MEWVETIGKTLDQAKEAALEQLGVDVSDAEFVVVAEPKAGLFGRLRGEARVRARVRPTQPRAKRGRDRHRGAANGRRGATSGESEGTASARAKPASPPVAPPRSKTPGRTPKRTSDNGLVIDTGPLVDAGVDDDVVRPGSDEVGSTKAVTSPSRPRRRGGRGRTGGALRTGDADVTKGVGTDHGDQVGQRNVRRASSGSGPAAAPADVEQIARGAGQEPAGRTDQVAAHRHEDRVSTQDQEKEEPVGEMTLQEQGKAAQEFVQGLVGCLGLHASVDVLPVDEETMTVAVEGDELGILVGPGGSTLAALQELTRTYVQKITGGQSDRIMVDVAGYRAKRVAALQRFTRGVAQEVAASGEPRALEAMSAADRKVVHDTVNEIDGVATRSEGEDDRRYVVILPSEHRGGD